MTMNWIDLPQGTFENRLMTARGIFHACASNAHQQSDAVQRERSDGELQRAPAVGVRSCRSFHRVQRRPDHREALVRGLVQPLGCDQADATASLLVSAAGMSSPICDCGRIHVAGPTRSARRRWLPLSTCRHRTRSSCLHQTAVRLRSSSGFRFLEWSCILRTRYRDIVVCQSLNR